MSEITTVGVDLAKEVIVVCAGDGAGRYPSRVSRLRPCSQCIPCATAGMLSAPLEGATER
jgi:hypothetical protein